MQSSLASAHKQAGVRTEWELREPTVARIAGLSREQWIDFLQSVKQEGSEADLHFCVRARCRYDIEAFTEIFFSHYCKYDFSTFHRDLFTLWKSDKSSRRSAIAAPRGNAKSTFVTLIKLIHDLCYGLEDFIVIFSNTMDQAVGRTKDIKAELLENDALKSVYGPFFGQRNIADGHFNAHSVFGTTRFVAYGTGSEVRGVRYGHARPSKIVLDDVEHSEEVFSEEIREGYFSWFREVVSNLGDKKTSIEIVGTMLHPKALLMELTHNPAYETAIYKSIVEWPVNTHLWEEWRAIYCDIDDPSRVIKADDYFEYNRPAMEEGAVVLWPDNEDLYHLMKHREEVGHKAFEKEKQNNPRIGDEALFDELQWYTETPQGYLIERTGTLVPKDELIQCIAVIDPAAGEAPPKKTKKGDFTCMLLGHVSESGRLFVSMDHTRRDKPSQYMEYIWDWVEQNDIDKFGIETNMYRNLLLPNIVAKRKEREKRRKDKGMRRWGLRCRFYDILNVENKVKRVYALEPKVAMGYILFNKKAMSQEFIHQMQEFPLGEHDDCPDALEMLWSMAEGRYDGRPFDGNPMRGR